jgi:hypothetical protein
VLELLADLLEAMDVHRIEGEDLDSMRTEAQRKLADITEVYFLPCGPLATTFCNETF